MDEQIEYTIHISKSMDIEQFFFCEEHNCKLDDLIEGLLLSFLWRNNELLKKLISQSSKDM